jgi:hypothetical protein
VSGPREGDERYTPGWDTDAWDEPGDTRGIDRPYDSWPEQDLDAPGEQEEPQPAEEGIGPGLAEPNAAEGTAAGAAAGVAAEGAAEAPGTPPPWQHGWDTKQFGDRRKPTTAEQAVPWLVGAVLALAGIVIVLLALIFSDANGGFGSATLQPTPLVVPSASTPASQSAAASPSTSPSASPTAVPTKPPSYGILEMLYVTRPSATAFSELLRDDFATAAGPTRVAFNPSADVTHYAVAPDGTVSVAIINRRLFGLAKNKPARVLASQADSATFGADATTVYAVHITAGATNDQARVSAITFASGQARALTTISYRHAAAPQLSGLEAARFLDEGGVVRIYSTSDGNLLLWVYGAGQWHIDPVSGSAVAASRGPTLWSPDGSHRIGATESGGSTTLSELAQDGRTLSRVTVNGLISHLRWSPKGNRVVFTLGLTLAGGGVRQDLYVWDLVNGRAASALTANGASYGAEWLGSAQFWEP